MEAVLDGVSAATSASFDEFVAARGADLWFSAWLLTGDKHHAEDLVQTALSKTYSRYDGFENDRHLESYVRTTLYRTFVSWWRRLHWRSEIPSGAPPEPVARPDDDPAQGADLQRALADLPRIQRAVLVLRCFEDPPVQGGGRPVADAAGHRHLTRQPRTRRLAPLPHLNSPEDPS